MRLLDTIMAPFAAGLLIFLAAAVRARWSVAVSGAMSAGKTTLMRALCAQIPADEAIGTFETEYELFLAESGFHDIVIDWEARPGVGEVRADGRAAGAFDLADVDLDALGDTMERVRSTLDVPAPNHLVLVLQHWQDDAEPRISVEDVACLSLRLEGGAIGTVAPDGQVSWRDCSKALSAPAQHAAIAKAAAR